MTLNSKKWSRPAMVIAAVGLLAVVGYFLATNQRITGCFRRRPWPVTRQAMQQATAKQKPSLPTAVTATAATSPRSRRLSGPRRSTSSSNGRMPSQERPSSRCSM